MWWTVSRTPHRTRGSAPVARAGGPASEVRAVREPEPGPPTQPQREPQPQPEAEPDASLPPFPSSKVLLFMLGPRSAYRPVLYSTREIFCGPDAADHRAPDGQPIGIRTPVGPYDAAQVVAAAAGGRVEPDLVVVKADATGRNFPLNLAAFACPKVLVVGNTQHLDAPIRRLLAYARQEKFDFVVSDHKRHHLHFFVEAGFPRVAWLPALNVHPHRQPPTSHEPRRELLFVGQTGKYHPFRNQVLGAVKQSGLPLTVTVAPQARAAALYAGSAISLNCSLNGDLNLRVFEVLSSGGFLLTDRLAPEAGLELLFEEGLHYEAFGGVPELIEKARRYLERPAAAAAIARAGAEAYWRAHEPSRKAHELMSFVFEGRLPAAYDIVRERRAASVPAASFEAVMARAPIYEALQELHLARASCRVLVDQAADERIVCDAVDLPRLRVTVTGTRARARPGALALWRHAGVLDRVSWLADLGPAGGERVWDALILDGHPVVSGAPGDARAPGSGPSSTGDSVVPSIRAAVVATPAFMLIMASAASAASAAAAAAAAAASAPRVVSPARVA